MTHSQSSTNIPSILEKIVNTKKREVSGLKRNKHGDMLKAEVHNLLESQRQPRRGFAKALRQKQIDRQVGVIAEIKKASPSKGVICSDFDPAFIAKQYEHAGATCLSVLTDAQYFKGDNQYLINARNVCHLPVLRKDFIIDPYQVYESYLLGADCILLIVACLEDDLLHQLHKIALRLGMDVLIEVHTQQELDIALDLPKSTHNIYGINNRDLNTFETDIQTSIILKEYLESSATSDPSLNTSYSQYGGKVNLVSQIEDDNQSFILVSESGIHTAEDIKLLLANNIYCFLIGEQFMKAPVPGSALSSLLDKI